MALRFKNAVVLAKIESSEGVDASPSATTDAVLVENFSISFNPNVVRTNEIGGSLDGRGAIIGGMTVGFNFEVYLKGSGSAGVAPEWGKLLKACGWAETLTATAVPAAPEACGAGGSTTAAELGTSASGTANAYRGMPIDFTGTVSGLSFITNYTSGKVATLTDTMGGAIAATTNYQIPANVLYTPASASIPTLTFYVYADGLLYKFVGARGRNSFELAAGGPGKVRFDFRCLFGGKSDASVPIAVYDATRPPVWKGGVASIDRLAAAMSSVSVDTGVELVSPQTIGSTEGFEPAIIVRRAMTGKMNPLETLVATRDVMADFRSGTTRIVHARCGSTVGNRIGLTIPAALYTNANPQDQQGLLAVGADFDCTGQDAGAFLCLY